MSQLPRAKIPEEPLFSGPPEGELGAVLAVLRTLYSLPLAADQRKRVAQAACHLLEAEALVPGVFRFKP